MKSSSMHAHKNIDGTIICIFASFVLLWASHLILSLLHNLNILDVKGQTLIWINCQQNGRNAQIDCFNTSP